LLSIFDKAPNNVIFYYRSKVFSLDMIATSEPLGYGTFFSGINLASVLAGTTLPTKAGRRASQTQFFYLLRIINL